MKFILAKKLGMSTLYNDGIAKNVTLLEAGKNVITAMRTIEKDGYNAMQIGLEKANSKEGKGKKYEKIQEIRLEDTASYKVNDELAVDQFELNDKVCVIGTSKGKGYAGVMKRHNFSGSPATHGHRHDHRAPGSIGCAFPERVFPGKRMAGRMGSERVTVKGLKVVLVDKEKKLIAIEGAIPGNNGAMVQVLVKK